MVADRRARRQQRSVDDVALVVGDRHVAALGCANRLGQPRLILPTGFGRETLTWQDAWRREPGFVADSAVRRSAFREGRIGNPAYEELLAAPVIGYHEISRNDVKLAHVIDEQQVEAAGRRSDLRPPRWQGAGETEEATTQIDTRGRSTGGWP